MKHHVQVICSEFKIGQTKKRQRTEESISSSVEDVMAELEIAADEDDELHLESTKPAAPVVINKLKKLPLLMNSLSRKNLHMEFLDRGLLDLMNNWIQPLPDGSLVDFRIRSSLLKILTKLSSDLDKSDKRVQHSLVQCGLGMALMQLLESDEETADNRIMAGDLIDSWKRALYYHGSSTTAAPKPKSAADSQHHQPKIMAAPQTCGAHRVNIMSKLKRMKANSRRPLRATRISPLGR